MELGTLIRELCSGMLVSLEIFVLTLVFSLPLGLLVGIWQNVKEYNTAFMDLESGACDAIAMDIGVANYQISSRENSDEYMILEEVISSEQYGIGFKKGNTELRDKVQATLDEMAEDGTIAKIAEKYADFGVPGALCVGK